MYISYSIYDDYNQSYDIDLFGGGLLLPTAGRLYLLLVHDGCSFLYSLLSPAGLNLGSLLTVQYFPGFFLYLLLQSLDVGLVRFF